MNEKKYNENSCTVCGYSDEAPFLPSYLPPKTILNDRYIIGKLLSYNGESALYIAYDKVTDMKVTIREYMPDALCTRDKTSPVIKINNVNFPLYKTYLSEFIELNKSLIKVRSMTHLQTALDIFADNNTGYVVLEFIEGIPLRTYLANSSELSWEHVKELFPPILTTLGLVHQAGIIHRGISPSTIFYTDKGELKLTGFNIAACRTANSELAGEIFAGYAAPEQYTPNTWHGTWTDVYGISAVLYHALTGSRPAEAIARLGHDNLAEPAVLNRNVPAHVSDVIMKAMSLTTNSRIQTITDLVDKLFELPGHYEVRNNVEKTAAKKRKKKKTKSKKPLVIGAVSTVVLFGFALAIILPLVFQNDNTNSDTSGLSLTSQTTTSTTPAATTTVSATMQTTSVISNDPEYFVPNFIDNKYEIIASSAKYTEMFTFKPIYEYNDQYQNGIVYEQDIEAETLVKKGAEITLKVSKGPKTVYLPDYKDKKIDDYLSELSKLNIKYEKLEYKTNDVKEGYVYMTNKDANSIIDVEIGETVRVYFAKNFEETTSESVSETVPESQEVPTTD